MTVRVESCMRQVGTEPEAIRSWGLRDRDDPVESLNPPPPPPTTHQAAPHHPPRRHCRHPAAPEQPREQTSHKCSVLRAAAAGSPQASTALLEPSRRQSHLLRRRWGHGSRRPVLGGRHQLLVTTIVSVDASAAPARRRRAPTPPSCSHSHGHRTSRLAD